MILDHFRLLQATDNLSLLTCVDFSKPAHLLHLLPLHGGGYAEVQVYHLGPRCMRLDPYPFWDSPMTLQFPARHVEGKSFSSTAELQCLYAKTPVELLSVSVSAK